MLMITLSDFRQIKRLGRGAYANVYLVEKNQIQQKNMQ